MEAAIQKALLNYLRTTPYHSDLWVCAPMNENSHKHIDMGVDVGCTDLIIGIPHKGIFHLFFLELKTKKGKLRDTQKTWNERFDNEWLPKCSNISRAVAYGYDDGIKQLDNFLLQMQR